MRGHLRKRVEDTWSLVVDIGSNPITGMRRQKWFTIKGTKRQAERRQAEIVAEIEGHEFYEPTRITLATWLRQWLDEHAAPTVRSNTLRRYRGIMEAHVIPAIGGIKLIDLKPQHI